MAEIPSDLHPTILKTLPSKTLLQFSTVSKSWYSIIKNHNFIKSHYNHHKSLNNNVFFLRAYSRYFLYHYHKPQRTRRTELPSPPDEFNEIVASLDSLICLSGSIPANLGLLLWNPSVNKFRKIEPPLTALLNHEYVVGLGRNHVNDDYTVVLITVVPLIDYHTRYTVLDDAHVYSINNPSLGWKSVALHALGYHVFTRFSRSCFVNDTIHWLFFYGDNGIELGASVVTFDPSNNCFANMALPTTLKEASDQDISLAVIGESLAVVHDEYEEGKPPMVVVWRMNAYGVEKSWMVLYRIAMSTLTNRQLWAEEDGKVFITTCCGELIVFDVNSGSNGFLDGDYGMVSGNAFAYTESLVLLDGLQRQQLEG